MLESYLIRGILIGLIFGVPAGAIGALTIQRTLRDGFAAGLATGFGSSAADLLYSCVGVFGITLVSDFLTRHQCPVSLLGGSCAGLPDDGARRHRFHPCGITNVKERFL